MAKQADERIEKLRRLSKNIEEEESFKEKIEIPAYLRRNVKLDDVNKAKDNTYLPNYKINDETGRSFFQIGYFIELFRKESEDTVIHNDIKDN